MTQAWLADAHYRHRSVVQFSEPMPALARSAANTVTIVWPHLIAPCT